MATVARNNIIRSVNVGSVFESAKHMLSATNDWNQGDLLAVDSGVIKAVTAVTDSAAFLGVAKQTIIDGKVQSPYSGTAVDASASIDDVAGPVFGVVASLKLKATEAFAPGALVYLDPADAQTVSSVQPGTEPSIGVYQGPNVASATSGQLGEIYIPKARYGL